MEKTKQERFIEIRDEVRALRELKNLDKKEFEKTKTVKMVEMSESLELGLLKIK